MGDNGITHPLDLIHGHVRIGGQCEVIRLETVIEEVVDGGMHLFTHGFYHHAVDGVVVALACRFQDVETRNVALLRLLAHRQQLIGETTHSRHHHNDRFRLGIDYIPEVKQTLDATHRGSAKFHHFHCYRYCYSFSNLIT